VLVFHVCEFERLGLHDKFKQEASSGEDVDFISLVCALTDMAVEFRCVALERANAIGVVICNSLAVLVDEVPSVPKIHDFDIEFRIQ
jgi:hypothetical protein